MRQRPQKKLDPNELRPCDHVELCRRDEAKACDNCYEYFWREHHEPTGEEINAAIKAAREAEEALSKGNLF